jgi:hypothetical protein
MYRPMFGIHSGSAIPRGYDPYPAHSTTGCGTGYPIAVGFPCLAPPTPGHLFPLPSPGPRSQGLGPHLHPQNRLALSTRYSQQQVARSDSSATHVEGLDETLVAGEPLIARTPQRAQALVKTPTKRSKELELLGIDPPTPDTTGLPEFLFENFGPTGTPPAHTTAMPASESSGLVPIDPGKYHEWDGETRVPDESVDAFAALSFIEKSLSERQTLLPVERSWTLKGMHSPSLVSHIFL